MKRCALTLGLLLLLGAVINVAVAWWCALQIDPFQSGNPASTNLSPYWNTRDERHIREPDGLLTLRVVQSRGALTIESIRGQADEAIFAPSEWRDLSHCCARLRLPTAEYAAGQAWMEYRRLQVRGWPMLSMCCEEQQHLLMKNATWVTRPGRLGIQLWLPPWQGGFRKEIPKMIPLEPVWPGFVVNTALFAGAMWASRQMFGAPLAIRRRKRRKRGQCVACGYPIGLSPVCTECGKPVTARDAKAPG